MINFTKVHELANTERSILSEISMVFDPLGLANIITVQGQLLLRDLWDLKLEWDVKVPAELHRRWVSLCRETLGNWRE